MLTSVLAVTNSASSAAGMSLVVFIYIAIFVIQIISWWAVFAKANQPRWAAIIPIYNFYIFTKVARRPTQWFILLLVPIVSIIVYLTMCFDIAKAFNKSTGFGVGLVFLPFIFYPVLGFGKSKYNESLTAGNTYGSGNLYGSGNYPQPSPQQYPPQYIPQGPQQYPPQGPPPGPAQYPQQYPPQYPP